MKSSLEGRDQHVRWLTAKAAGFTLLLLAAPAAAAAQQAAPVVPGERVRVRVAPSGRHYTGNLAALRSDTLILDAPRRRSLSLPLGSVVGLERSRGPGRCRSRPGARLSRVALGTVTGALLGGVISYQATKCTECDSSGIGMLLGVPAGATLGLVVGAVVGGERWERVPVPGSSGRR